MLQAIVEKIKSADGRITVKECIHSNRTFSKQVSVVNALEESYPNSIYYVLSDSRMKLDLANFGQSGTASKTTHM